MVDQSTNAFEEFENLFPDWQNIALLILIKFVKTKIGKYLICDTPL